MRKGWYMTTCASCLDTALKPSGRIGAGDGIQTRCMLRTPRGRGCGHRLRRLPGAAKRRLDFEAEQSLTHRGRPEAASPREQELQQLETSLRLSWRRVSLRACIYCVLDRPGCVRAAASRRAASDLIVSRTSAKTEDPFGSLR
eukprot:scaffold38406_cov58-Phaeocystis_antarctica.AAC.3